MVASHGIESKERLGRHRFLRKAVNASEEFLGQRNDDASRASHVAESVLVLILGHLADEFGALGAQGGDSVVGALDCKHDAPQSQRVRRWKRRFDLDQFWIAKLRQLKPPVPIWGPHHNDVDLDAFEPVDAVHPRALDPRLAFERHAERGEKSDSGCKVVDDDADAADEDFAVRSQRDRPADVQRDCAVTDLRGAAGLLHTGAAGDEGGPDGRAALRIKRQVLIPLPGRRCYMLCLWM